MGNVVAANMREGIQFKVEPATQYCIQETGVFHIHWITRVKRDGKEDKRKRQMKGKANFFRSRIEDLGSAKPFKRVHHIYKWFTTTSKDMAFKKREKKDKSIALLDVVHHQYFKTNPKRRDPFRKKEGGNKHKNWKKMSANVLTCNLSRYRERRDCNHVQDNFIWKNPTNKNQFFNLDTLHERVKCV